MTCCLFSSVKTLLMPTKAILPYAGINVLGSFSLAGFQVTIIGRIWVTAEGEMINHLQVMPCMLVLLYLGFGEAQLFRIPVLMAHSGTSFG